MRFLVLVFGFRFSVRILQISQPLYTFLRFIHALSWSRSRSQLFWSTLARVWGLLLFVVCVCFFLGVFGVSLDRDTFCCVCVGCVWFIDFYICVYVYVCFYTTSGGRASNKAVRSTARGSGLVIVLLHISFWLVVIVK